MNAEHPTPQNGWDIASLTALFASDPASLGDVDVDIKDDVLFVTVKEKGDLVVSIVAAEDQLRASILLVEESQVPASAEFNRALLTLHKAIPLSTFGITTVDNASWYELFGALSSSCSADNVVEEVVALVANAGETAEWLSEWGQQHGATGRNGEKA